MKTKIKLAAFAMVLGIGLMSGPSIQAANSVETGKGTRLTTVDKVSVRSNRLSTLADFKSLQKGDRVSAWCPMMKKTYVTTIRNVDSKGHVKITSTQQGMKIDGCNIVLQRKSDSKEVQSLMRCPDGTLTPIECSKV